MGSQAGWLRGAVSVSMLGLALLATACGPASTGNTNTTAPAAVSTPVVEPAASEEVTEEAEHAEGEHAEDETHAEGEAHAESTEHPEGADHAEGEAHEGEHAEGEEHERLPNEDAVIQIVLPADGATFGVDEEIVVEIETINFTLGEDGRHWELYVDGESWGSIEGGNQDEVIRGLEPGEHEITAYLSLGSHQQLAEGSTIHITVEE